MATPVGHALAGTACALVFGERPRWGGRGWWVAVVLAVAADFDFLPGLLSGRPALYHQGISHSLVFALGAGLVAAAIAHRGARRVRWFALGGCAYGSHLVVDWFGPDRRPPFGMPWLWPFSDRVFLAPHPLLPGVKHAKNETTGTGAWLQSVVSWENVEAVLVEAAFLAPLVGCAWAWWWWRARRSR